MSLRVRIAIIAGIVGGLLSGCDGDSPLELERRAGSLDLSRIVAIGDGFVAGVTDGALFRSAQEASVPALFARRVAGHESFPQPLVADPGFAADTIDGGRLVLERFFPPLLTRRDRGGPPLALELDRPYSNLAVPGALMTEALTAESGGTSILGNEFYDLVLRGRGTAVEQATELRPTLLLVWFGTSEVRRFVAAGGDPGLAPGLPTPPATFGLTYERLLDALEPVADRIVLFNVPDVTLTPIAQTVPTVVVDPETWEPVTITVFEPIVDPETGDTLRVPRERTVPLLGPDGSLAEEDRVLLDALPLIAQGIGVPSPLGGTGDSLPDHVVLDASEGAVARAAVTGYNEAIERLARERGLVVVDVHALVEEIATDGVISDGILLTAAFPEGQAFGLDGVRFTPKGNGLVVNRLIRKLNEATGSDLFPVRTSDLRGVPILPPR